MKFAFNISHGLAHPAKPFFRFGVLVILCFMTGVTYPLSSSVLAQSATPTPIVVQLLPSAPIPPEPTIIVNLLDDGPSHCPADCTLRGAIKEAQSGDVIGFAPDLTGRIRLSETLVIDKSLTIVGPGADRVALDGQDKFTIVEIEQNWPVFPHHQVTIFGLTIQNGKASSHGWDIGGGIFNLGDLTLVNSIVSNNSAGSGAGISHGGHGKLTIYGSTISHNRARSGGGGIFQADGQVTLIDSTISENTGERFNGGISNQAGLMTIINSTVSGNSAPLIGGIRSSDRLEIISSTISGNWATDSRDDAVDGIASESALIIASSIIANNQNGDDSANLDLALDSADNLTSLGNNLIGIGIGIEGLTSTDTLGTDPNLLPLADNGGITQTMALEVGSPAIGGGNCNLLFTVMTDQRGVLRKILCDVGAFESEFNTN